MTRTLITITCLISACWGPPTDQQRCEGGAARACMHVGEEYAAGILRDRDLTKALHYFEESCRLGDAEGCLKVAEARTHGHGGVKDPGAAQKALSRSCQLGSIGGCQDFAEALQAAGNAAGAKAAWARSCKLGDDAACNKLDGLDAP